MHQLPPPLLFLIDLTVLQLPAPAPEATQRRYARNLTHNLCSAIERLVVHSASNTYFTYQLLHSSLPQHIQTQSAPPPQPPTTSALTALRKRISQQLANVLSRPFHGSRLSPLSAAAASLLTASGEPSYDSLLDSPHSHDATATIVVFSNPPQTPNQFSLFAPSFDEVSAPRNSRKKSLLSNPERAHLLWVDCSNLSTCRPEFDAWLSHQRAQLISLSSLILDRRVIPAPLAVQAAMHPKRVSASRAPVDFVTLSLATNPLPRHECNLLFRAAVASLETDSPLPSRLIFVAKHFVAHSTSDSLPLDCEVPNTPPYVLSPLSDGCDADAARDGTMGNTSAENFAGLLLTLERKQHDLAVEVFELEGNDIVRAYYGLVSPLTAVSASVRRVLPKAAGETRPLTCNSATILTWRHATQCTPLRMLSNDRVGVIRGTRIFAPLPNVVEMSVGKGGIDDKGDAIAGSDLSLRAIAEAVDFKADTVSRRGTVTSFLDNCMRAVTAAEQSRKGQEHKEEIRNSVLGILRTQIAEHDEQYVTRDAIAPPTPMLFGEQDTSLHSIADGDVCHEVHIVDPEVHMGINDLPEPTVEIVGLQLDAGGDSDENGDKTRVQVEGPVSHDLAHYDEIAETRVQVNGSVSRDQRDDYDMAQTKMQVAGSVLHDRGDYVEVAKTRVQVDGSVLRDQVENGETRIREVQSLLDGEVQRDEKACETKVQINGSMLREREDYSEIAGSRVDVNKLVSRDQGEKGEMRVSVIGYLLDEAGDHKEKGEIKVSVVGHQSDQGAGREENDKARVKVVGSLSDKGIDRNETDEMQGEVLDGQVYREDKNEGKVENKDGNVDGEHGLVEKKLHNGQKTYRVPEELHDVVKHVKLAIEDLKSSKEAKARVPRCLDALLQLALMLSKEGMKNDAVRKRVKSRVGKEDSVCTELQAARTRMKVTGGMVDIGLSVGQWGAIIEAMEQVVWLSASATLSLVRKKHRKRMKRSVKRVKTILSCIQVCGELATASREARDLYDGSMSRLFGSILQPFVELGGKAEGADWLDELSEYGSGMAMISPDKRIHTRDRTTIEMESGSCDAATLRPSMKKDVMDSVEMEMNNQGGDEVEERSPGHERDSHSGERRRSESGKKRQNLTPRSKLKKAAEILKGRKVERKLMGRAQFASGDTLMHGGNTHNRLAIKTEHKKRDKTLRKKRKKGISTKEREKRVEVLMQGLQTRTEDSEGEYDVARRTEGASREKAAERPMAAERSMAASPPMAGEPGMAMMPPLALMETAMTRFALDETAMAVVENEDDIFKNLSPGKDDDSDVDVENGNIDDEEVCATPEAAGPGPSSCLNSSELIMVMETPVRPARPVGGRFPWSERIEQI